MEKEEKEIKKSTKKTTTTKTAPVKKSGSAKKEPVKKVTEKKTTTKKTVKKEKAKPVAKEAKKEPVKKVAPKKTTTKKAPTKKEVVKPVIKEEVVVKEEKNIETPSKEESVVVAGIKTNKSSKELFELRKKRYILETIIIAVVVIVALLFLCNKTFLKTNYKTEAINVSIPRFSYYVKDKDNIVKFYTLRKSANLKEYYNEYLEGFIFYSCAEGNNTFYYNEETKTLIKDIKVEKKFAIKTVEITYDGRTPEEVCGLR